MTKSPIITVTKRIYIDANVLINYCTGQADDRAELRGLFSAKSSALLYTSNLAIVQTIAKLQTKTKKRNALTLDEIKKYIQYFYSHITVCEVSNQIIKRAMEMTSGVDMEDNIHFQISQSVKCNTILTNNKKDYAPYPVYVVVPGKLKYGKRY